MKLIFARHKFSKCAQGTQPNKHRGSLQLDPISEYGPLQKVKLQHVCPLTSLGHCWPDGAPFHGQPLCWDPPAPHQRLNNSRDKRLSVCNLYYNLQHIW